MKSRKSYCTTVGISVGVSKMLKFLRQSFLCDGARRCQASYPVPVTGLVCQGVETLSLELEWQTVLTRIRLFLYNTDLD